MQQVIPTIALPLQAEDAMLALEVQDLLLTLYDQARYDLAIDYSKESIPPLTESDRSWAHDILVTAGRR